MGRVLLAFAMVMLCSELSFLDAAKTKKPPDVQVIECKARRGEANVTLDGRVRNSGEKPIRGLTVVFDFMAPGGSVVTSQKTEVEETLLQPGKDAVFHVELVDPVRAVNYQISAVDGSGKDLRVANSGPFVIE